MKILLVWVYAENGPATGSATFHGKAYPDGMEAEAMGRGAYVSFGVRLDRPGA